MKKYIMFILMLIISIVSASAEYSQVGGDSNLFSSDSGNFNSNLVDTSTTGRTLGDPKGIPLVSDLNNDGFNEIIVIDGNNLRLYQNKTLSILDSVILNTSSPYSYIVYDIDGDNLKEVIVGHQSNGAIDIIDYNVSISVSTIGAGANHGTNSDILINCEDTEKCIAIYGSSVTGDTDTLFSSFFNSSGVYNQISVHTDGGGDGSLGSAFCTSSIPYMPVTDIDNDGIEDYVSSWIINAPGLSSDIIIVSVSVNSTNGVTLNKVKTDARSKGKITGFSSCVDDNKRNFFSSPLLYNIDLSAGNGIETVVGFMTQDTNDEFKMFSYDSTIEPLDDYPEIFEADGLIVSNPALFNAFTDTGKHDVCMLGFQETIQEIDLLCFSEVTAQIPETLEFAYDYSGSFNLTTQDVYNNMIHSTQQSQATTDSNNLDELSCSYGIFSIDYSGTNELQKIFTAPKTNGALLMTDAENVGLSDMMILTDTNIWYIDDKFSNSPGAIDSYVINPCIDSVWKFNGTSQITITPTDAEGDKVRARAQLYYNNAFEQDSNWSSYLSSGTSFIFTFNINETVTNGLIRLSATDQENPNIEDEIILTFSVNSNGVSLNDCVTSIDGLVNATAFNDSSIIIPTSEPDNLPTRATNDIARRFNVSTSIGWLIIMLVIAGAMFFFGYDAGENTKDLLMVIGIVEIVLLILGTALKIIEPYILWTIVVIGALYIGVVAGSKFFDRGGSV